MLSGKKILLGITGSIAAYKAAMLVRLLMKANAEVKVIMTEASTEFISPLTISTLAKSKVVHQLSEDGDWENHVELGLWADIMLVAPCTAQTIAKMANGLCDNALTATFLSAKCPVMFAPAMDLDMWKHPAVQRNITLLQQDSHQMIDVEDGELASGLIGKGRMAEPETIVEKLVVFLSVEQSLTGKTFLVNAGPTHEAIDPVRFIGNRSTGKMGVAIANQLKEKGAKVHLVLGPSNVFVPKGIKVYNVESAKQMADKCLEIFPKTDGAILAAAVADFTPKEVFTQKKKKSSDGWNLELERTIDIAATLKNIKKPTQKVIGFALETNNALENAVSKRERKGFDFIVLNSLEDKGAGFGHDTNKVRLVFDHNKVLNYELMSKTEVAKIIVEQLEVL